MIFSSGRMKLYVNSFFTMLLTHIDAHIIIYLCLNPSGVFRYCCNPMVAAERRLCYYTVRACKHISSTGIKLSKVVLSHRDTASEARTPGMRWDVLHMYWSYVPRSHREWNDKKVNGGTLTEEATWSGQKREVVFRHNFANLLAHYWPLGSVMRPGVNKLKVCKSAPVMVEAAGF